MKVKALLSNSCALVQISTRGIAQKLDRERGDSVKWTDTNKKLVEKRYGGILLFM
jgi:hypothetical protein